MKDNPEPLVFSVGEKEFEQAVIAKSHETPVVVDFWAPWCGPCRMLAPVLEQLVAKRNGDVLLAKVNTDEEQGLAAKYGVSVLPTVIAFRRGKPVLDFEGLLPESNLAAFLDRLCPTEADRTVQDAAHLEKAEPVKAEKLYREALRLDRNQEAARLGLARLLIAQDKDGEAVEILEPLAATGENGEEIERLNSLLWLKNQARHCGDEATLRARFEVDPNNSQTNYDLACVLAAKGDNKTALDLLLAAGQRDRKIAKEKVREAMVKVFNVVGPRSEMAEEYRDKLAALLY